MDKSFPPPPTNLVSLAWTGRSISGLTLSKHKFWSLYKTCCCTSLLCYTWSWSMINGWYQEAVARASVNSLALIRELQYSASHIACVADSGALRKYQVITLYYTRHASESGHRAFKGQNKYHCSELQWYLCCVLCKSRRGRVDVKVIVIVII